MSSKRISKFDNASQVFAVANTPLFVVRKLKADPEVLKLSLSLSSAELLSKLRRALSRKPTNLHSAVLPYVYLMALAFQQDITALDFARRPNGSLHDWYSYISEAVFQMTPATNVSSIVAAGANA